MTGAFNSKTAHVSQLSISYVKNMEQYMDLNLDILREKVAEYCSRNEGLDLKKFLHYYTIDVLGELV